MPLSDESFPCQLVNVAEVDADPENGIKASIQIHFGMGGPPELGFDGALLVKRLVGMAPKTAIAVGEALIEGGKRLDRPELAVVDGMDAAEVEAEAYQKLRAAPDPA